MDANRADDLFRLFHKVDAAAKQKKVGTISMGSTSWGFCIGQDAMPPLERHVT